MKKHIEFILNDENALRLLDEYDVIYKKYDEATNKVFIYENNLSDTERKGLYRLMDELQEQLKTLLDRILNNYYVDNEIDRYGCLHMALIDFTALNSSKDVFIKEIRQEQERRGTRKRQPKRIKERLAEIGLA